MLQKLEKLNPEAVVNTYHRLGKFGPAYQVMGISRKLDSGDILMNIHMLENRENIEYPFSCILNDPIEE